MVRGSTTPHRPGLRPVPRRLRIMPRGLRHAHTPLLPASLTLHTHMPRCHTRTVLTQAHLGSVQRVDDKEELDGGRGEHAVVACLLGGQRRWSWRPGAHQRAATASPRHPLRGRLSSWAALSKRVGPRRWVAMAAGAAASWAASWAASLGPCDIMLRFPRRGRVGALGVLLAHRVQPRHARVGRRRLRPRPRPHRHLACLRR